MEVFIVTVSDNKSVIVKGTKAWVDSNALSILNDSKEVVASFVQGEWKRFVKESAAVRDIADCPEPFVTPVSNAEKRKELKEKLQALVNEKGLGKGKPVVLEC